MESDVTCVSLMKSPADADKYVTRTGFFGPRRRGRVLTLRGRGSPMIVSQGARHICIHMGDAEYIEEVKILRHVYVYTYIYIEFQKKIIKPVRMI